MEDYRNSTKLNIPADRVFDALTNAIPLWWTEMFEGTSNKAGDSFTVRFGENVYKTMHIKELSHNKKTVWFVEDSLINIPDLNNQQEWIGTTIVWQIQEIENGVELNLTHMGLHLEIECYEICSSGWKEFIDSLKLYLETGKGKPFRLS